MANVHVRRKGINNIVQPYEVEVDGISYGALRTGNLQFDLSPGSHRIVIGLDSALTFDNSDGEDTHIVFKVSVWNNRAKITVSR
jgi:hypothetical protein